MGEGRDFSLLNSPQTFAHLSKHRKAAGIHGRAFRTLRTFQYVFILPTLVLKGLSSFIKTTWTLRAFCLVKNLRVIVPVNLLEVSSTKNCFHIYKQYRRHFLWVYRCNKATWEVRRTLEKFVKIQGLCHIEMKYWS